jgi:hypothetical protein
MVEGNDLLPYNKTMGLIPPNMFGDELSADELLRTWDLIYKLRARKHGEFLTCEANFLEIYQPSVLTDKRMLQIFSRIS